MARLIRLRITAAMVAAVGLAGACAGSGTGGGTGGGGGLQAIHLVVKDSRFVPALVPVEEGTTVRLVVHNQDLIDHELIIGDTEVHRRHEDGTERWHGTIPGEVSVPAGTTGETTFRFTAAGDVLFACHLPGHFAFGMQGTARAR